MVVKRKISKDKYMIAAVLTILLFALGLVLGMLIDNERVRWLEQASKEQGLDFKSLQFQYLYLTELEDDSNSCSVLRTTLKESVKELSSSLDRFQEFKEQTSGNSGDYIAVGRQYILDNMNYWLFARKSREACGIDVVTILYFYRDDCDVCPNQGVILSYFKNLFGDKLLVFPIDAGLEQQEPVVEILLNRFNITEYPTLIVEDKKFEGVVWTDDLKEIICPYFKNESSC